MHGESLGARLRKRSDKAVRMREHQVDIKMQFREGTESGDDLRAKTNVGHEMPIHDVEVHPRQPSLFDRTDTSDEFAVVGGEKRRSDDRGRHITKRL